MTPETKPLLTVRDITGTCAIVSFADDTNRDQLQTEVHALISAHSLTHLCFDLTGVTRLRQGTLGMFIELLKNNIDVTVHNPSPSIRELLKVTWVERVVKITTSDS